MGPVVKILGNWSFHVVDLQRTANKCTKNYNALAQPLLCSNLLFGDVLVAVAVAVAVMFCVRSLSSSTTLNDQVLRIMGNANSEFEALTEVFECLRVLFRLILNYVQGVGTSLFLLY